MKGRHLTVRIYVDESSDGSALEETLRSIRRSRGRLRRMGCRAEVLILPSPASPMGHHDVQWGHLAGLPTTSAVNGADAERAGAQRADPSGGLVAVCRAGEVLDPRFLASAVRALRAYDAPAVVHADHVLVIADEPLLLRTPDSRRDAIPLEALIDGDPWPGCRVTTAAVVSDLASAAADGESWSAVWTMRSIAAGVHQLTVAAINVITFEEWIAGSPAPLPIDADRLRSALESLFTPTSGAMASWERFSSVASGPIRIVGRGHRGILRRMRVMRSRLQDRVANRGALGYLRSAGSSDATLPDHSLSTRVGSARGGAYAHILVSGWLSLGRTTDILIVTPQVSTRSSDQVALQYARVLGEEANAARVGLITSGRPEETDSGLIPPTVAHHPFPPEFRQLTVNQQSSLTVRLAAMVRARHLLLIDCPFAEQIPEIPIPDAAALRVWLHDSSLGPYAVPDAMAVPPASDPSWVTEGPSAAARVAEQRGISADRVRIHVPPPLPVLPDFDTVTQYTAAFDDDQFDDEHPFRALWRTTDDDEPARRDALRALVAAIADSGLPIRVHVHREVASSPDAASAGAAAGPHFEDDGSFTGGLLNVPSENYHCLVLDSPSSRCRTFTMQAMLLGLPVLTSSPADEDLIVDRVSGLIVTDPRGSSLVSGLRAMLSSRQIRRTMIRGAHDRARGLIESHPFRTAVLRDLELTFGPEPPNPGVQEPRPGPV